MRICAVAIAFLTAPWLYWQEMDDLPPDEVTEDSGDVATMADPLDLLPSQEPNGRPRRILYLDHTAAIGGGEIALINLLQHLNREAYEPVVVLFSDGPFKAMLEAASIETHLLNLPDSVVNTRKESLTGWKVLLRAGDMLRIFNHARSLADFIRAGRFDLVHTNSLKSDIVGGLAGRMCGQTILWHVRDRIHVDYLPRLAVVSFRTICCMLADFVVTNSHATLELLRPTYGELLGSRAAWERMRVVHDGVVQSSFVESKDHDSRIVIIGLVGRISPFKGQDVFVQAAAKVLSRYPDCRFRIIGAALFNEEAYEKHVHQLVHELKVEHAIEFTGFREDVVDAVAELDILVHASVTGEPFGQVIVEGMAAGKPVIATLGGGVPEIVQHGSTGLLVPMRDADALAEGICQFLANPAAAAEMGLRGRQRVQDHFRIEHTARKIESFYRYIFSRRDGQPLTAPPPSRQFCYRVVLTWLVVAGVAAEFTYSIVECVRAFHG